jgi:hypothetical protein
LDYFQFPAPAPDQTVWLHRFRHESTLHPQSEALQLYEISIRYYVLGLRRARSPYAFHTVGSTITFNAHAYATVRGFPRREAAEDFYLLDKLAKLGPVVTRPGEPTELAFRPSDRVPFGTGKGMRQIAEDMASGKPFQLLHPECFENLGQWLHGLREFCVHRDVDKVRSALGGGLARLLEGQGAFAALDVARRTRPEQRSLERHVHTWFDALRTLKLLHALRDAGLGRLPWRDALDRCGIPQDAEPAALCRSLESLEFSFSAR